MKMKWNSFIGLIFISILIYFIPLTQKSVPTNAANTLFKLISPDSSNIHFTNTITTSRELNFFTFEYVYNGGGVGVGDFNKDGLQDLFFSGNQVQSKLYINKGNFKFEDITATAEIVIDKGFPFGVAVVDINQDGLQDIYVSIGGPGRQNIYPNKLFINKGNDKNNYPHFKEMSNEYGLKDSGQSIQAVFFDYDKDGDLDMYQLRGGGFEKSPNDATPVVKDGTANNTDKLYRNDFDKTLNHPLFTDVSKQAGILQEGFGLGVSLIDINEDGWQDIYVTNDYLTSDELYINNKNGTFTESVKAYFKHTSLYAMGNDVGDINNDGLVDVLAVDMLPEEHEKKMLMYGPNQYDKFYAAIGQGYSYEYMRNTLQLNRGNGKFSEIGQLAGIYKTSWSWAPLFADLDNDGYQDIFISNGFPKDITDLDFVKFRSNIKNTHDPQLQLKALIDSLSIRPGVKAHPYLYRNNGNLTFADSSEQWGFSMPGYSNGAAYADFDNDGDLDLVTNNIDEPAHLYQNTTIQKNKGYTTNFLKIKLKAAVNNIDAVGSKIDIKYNNQIQTRSLHNVRGFESSVEMVAHFGLGSETSVDTLIINWPDGKTTLLKNVKANQQLIIDYNKSDFTPVQKNMHITTFFTEINPSLLNINYKNRLVAFNDFNYERLLPKKYSQNGPGIVIGDVNADGLEDFFVGGMYMETGQVYLQNKNGTFTGHGIGNAKEYAQDAGCLLFDADTDGDLDLYIVSGGSEFDAKDREYQDRLYKNDGKGNFTKDENALPQLFASKSCVVAADYDNDGDLDLFVGSSIATSAYPTAPNNYLLQNNNGQFTDVTNIVAPGLKNIGMINSAKFTDVDNNNTQDLILAGEFLPITIFKNRDGKFINNTIAAGLQNTEGWWQSIAGADFDNDGDIDYVMGNWGINTPYKASASKPIEINYKDFDGNGSIDPIISYYDEGINYPVAPWDFITEQLPSLRKKIPTYASYASLSKEKLFSYFDKTGMQTMYCKILNSVYLQNDGSGNFIITYLPIETQFAPVLGMLAEDINADGSLDLITTGNFYGTEVVTGRYDAAIGLVLYGDGKGNFETVTNTVSGFVADKDTKAIGRLSLANNKLLVLVTQNADSLKIFKDNRVFTRAAIVPAAAEIFAMATLKNGNKRKIEFGYGSSYLSQSSNRVLVTTDIKSVTLYNAAAVKTRSFNF